MIYEFTPYARDKRYGQVLNSHISLLPEDAWICVRDRDTMYLTPDSGDIMYEAIKKYPSADLFTCSTNRGPGQKLDPETDIREHCRTAAIRALNPCYSTYGKEKVFPAYWWLFPKRTWRNNRFDNEVIITEQGTFDTRWCRDVGSMRIKIEHLYIFHLFRLYKDHGNISHFHA